MPFSDSFWLAVDTATSCPSISLANVNSKKIIATEQLTGDNPSRALLKTVDGVLTRHNVVKQQLSRVVFNCGPGNFIGMRCGFAFASALHLGWRTSLSPICSLAAMAFSVYKEDNFTKLQQPCCVFLYARQDKYYVGDFANFADVIWQVKSPFDSEFLHFTHKQGQHGSPENLAQKMLECALYADVAPTQLADIKMLYLQNDVANAKQHTAFRS